MLSYRIEDMTCGHCASTIARAVRAADAWAGLEIDLHAKLIHIRPGEASAAELIEAISEAGYHPTPVTAAQRTDASGRSGGGCCCNSGGNSAAVDGRPSTSQGQTNACGALAG